MKWQNVYITDRASSAVGRRPVRVPVQTRARPFLASALSHPHERGAGD